MPVNETLLPDLKFKQTLVSWIFPNTFCGTLGKTVRSVDSEQAGKTGED